MPDRHVNRTALEPITGSWGTKTYGVNPASYRLEWPATYTVLDESRDYLAIDEFESSSNGRNWAKQRGALADVGGNFTMRRSHLSSSGIPPGYRWRSWTSQHIGYRNPYFAVPSVVNAAEGLGLEDTLYLGPLGAKAIAACRPGKPESDMLTSVIELVREGLPKAIGAQSLADRSLRGASGDWLNYQFGVLPLVSDIKSLFETVRDQDALIDKINASSGKPVRRRFEFEPENENVKTPVHLGVILPEWYGGTSSNPGPEAGFRVDSTRRRVWFSGSFTSYVSLPREDRAWAERTAGIAKNLYGVRVSPELIWNLTPWTWAADWVTNAGDVVANASAFLSGDVVMHRGYIMAETHASTQWTVSLPSKNMADWSRFGPFNCWEPLRGSQQWSYVSKVRRRANPYNVGFTGEGLDLRQMSILVALGISRR